MAHNFTENEEMLRSFRCQDLANLLTYAGQSKNGKKSELLDRCLNILKKGNPTIIIKIREIYNQKINTTTNYSSLISTVNSNSNSSSGSPDPGSSMMNGRYQPAAPYTGYSQYASSNQGINMQVPAYPGMLGHHNTRSMLGYNQQLIQVKFEKLAFYEFLHELLPPNKLMPTNSRPHLYNFNFFMSTDQANEITGTRELINGKLEFSKQIHLRFGYYEPSIQADNLPANLTVTVNGKPAQLPAPKPTSKPNADILRPGRSIDITSQCRLAPNMPNKVDINWVNPDQSKLFCVGVYVFRKVSVEYLLKSLKTKILSAEVTRQMIKEKLQITDSDFEIETNELKVSLMCPLMKFRMNLPGRATTCKHVQCFDLESYLMMNEKKPVWNCPVCDQNAPYDNLIIDTLNQEIISQCGSCEEVVFSKDGSWKKIEEESKSSESKKSESNVYESCVELICDDDSPEKGPAPVATSTNNSAPKPTMCVIDLTIDSSSDEEEPEQSMATTSKNIDQIKLDIDSVTQSSGAVKSNEQLNIEISAKDNSESESNTSDMMRHNIPKKSCTNTNKRNEEKSAQVTTESPNESIISISSSESSRSTTPVPESQSENPVDLPETTTVQKQPVKPLIQPSKFHSPEKKQGDNNSPNGKQLISPNKNLQKLHPDMFRDLKEKLKNLGRGPYTPEQQKQRDNLIKHLKNMDAKQQTTPTNTNISNSSSKPSSTSSSPMDQSSIPSSKITQSHQLTKNACSPSGLSNSQLARGISMGTSSNSSSLVNSDTISNPLRGNSKPAYINSFNFSSANENTDFNHSQMQAINSTSSAHTQQRPKAYNQISNTSGPSRETIERQNRLREQQQKILSGQQFNRNIQTQPQKPNQPQHLQQSSHQTSSTSSNNHQRVQSSSSNNNQSKSSMEKRLHPLNSSQHQRPPEHLMIGNGVNKLQKRSEVMNPTILREKAMMTLDDELKSMAANPHHFAASSRNRMAPGHNSQASFIGKTRQPQQAQNLNYNLKEKNGLKRPSCDRDISANNLLNKKQYIESGNFPDNLPRSSSNHQPGYLSDNQQQQRNVSTERPIKPHNNSQYSNFQSSLENNNSKQYSNPQISPNSHHRSNSRGNAHHSPNSPGNNYNNLQQNRQVLIGSPIHHSPVYNSGIPSQYQYHIQQHTQLNSPSAQEFRHQRQHQAIRHQNLHNS